MKLEILLFVIFFFFLLGFLIGDYFAIKRMKEINQQFKNEIGCMAETIQYLKKVINDKV